MNTSKDYTILYVEDEKAIRINVKNCLDYIFNVIVAKNGEEGLEKFNKNKIDLIITDINMPLKDGIWMIKEIREVDSSIPCIITSAIDRDIIDKIKNLSISKCISKPFDIQDLLNSSLATLGLK